MILCGFFASSLNRRLLLGFLYFNCFFSSLQEVVFFNFSHLCTSWGTLPGRSCLDPPPSLKLTTLWCSDAKQTAVQTPQIITGDSHWERRAGKWLWVSGCPPVFADIHLHMSRPQPIRCHACWFDFRRQTHAVAPWRLACCTFIISPDKIVSPTDTLHFHYLSAEFTFSAHSALCTLI